MLLRTLLLATLLLGCASRPKGPPAPFATGIDPRWPSERFVVGVGEGAGLEAARRQAVTAIASQLRASLRASEVIEARAAIGETDGKSRSRSTESVSQDIRVDVRFDRLQWIRFVDSHVEKDRVHVLAVLDRREVSELLLSEIGSHRNHLRLSLDDLEDQGNLKRLKDGLEALRPTREDLLAAQQLLSAVERRPASQPPELLRLEELDRKLARIQSSVTVRVCVDSPLGEKLAGRFAATLGDEGLRTVSCDEEAAGNVVRLQGELRARSWSVPPQPGAWSRFCTVGLDYRVVGDAWDEGGSEPGRQTGGATEAEACHSSLEALARNLGDRLGLSRGGRQR